MGTAGEDDTGRLPRMQLDDLLEELQVRVDAVRGTRDRIHSLLEAVLSVGRELDLSQVLQRIVQTAVALVDAEYGALGVIGDDGKLAQYIPVGAGEEQESGEEQEGGIGPLPDDQGLLGELVRNPQLRLAGLSLEGEAPQGPPDQPPMYAFLGVPIRVRDEVFGNLYLAQKRSRKEFDSEDETVLSTLAVAAGIAVENARLYEESRYRQRWLEANDQITRTLLVGTGENEVLQLIMDQARTILSADLGVLALPGPDGETLDVAVAAGTDAEWHRQLRLPREGSFVGAAITAGDLIKSADVEHDPRITAGPLRWKGLGPAVAVPMTAGEVTRGVLLLARKHHRYPFSDIQTAPLRTFAGQAALAMELAERRRDAEQLTLLEDRDRIARDLHDLAIQRLFATGMTLQSAARFVEHPKASERLLRAVGDLDTTIKIIRTTIFGLRAQEAEPGAEGFRSRIASSVRAAVPGLGFTPSLRTEGLLETGVPAAVTDHAIAVLNEALSNVARHAQATVADVSVRADGEQFTLSVGDNGTGLPAGGRHSGLRNLAERARELGGELSLSAPESGGTMLTWRVPLDGCER